MQEEESNPIKDFTEQLIQYSDAKIELLKLNTYEKIAQFTAILAPSFIIIVLVLFFVLSLFLAFAFYVGQLLHNYAFGFLACGLLYLALIFLFSLAFKKSFKNFIINKLIQLFLKDTDEE